MAKTINTQPKIIVVGAGLAGLTAAYRLQQRGHDVHVYEARQRPGGRVLSAKLGDAYEELGGENFLHANEGQLSLKLIRELNLEVLDFAKPFSCAYANGSIRIAYQEVFNQFQCPPDMWELMEKTAGDSQNLQEVIDKIFKHTPELCTLLSQAITTLEGLAPKNLDPDCIDSLHELYSIFEKHASNNDSKAGQNKRLSLKGGNGKLPLALAKKLNDKIHYGKVLTGLKRESGKCILTFNQTQEIKADMVLLALPCPPLNDIKFAPGTIPHEQLTSILNVSYGTNAKILVPITLTKNTFDLICSPPHFFTWLNQDDSVITLYFGGEAGIFDQGGAESIFTKGRKILADCYGDIQIHAHSLECAKDEQLISYTGGVFKSWAKDPFAKGSYSTRGVGKASVLNDITTVQGEQVRTLFKPVHNQIFFAGEHTTTLPVLGTMESAIESGERMARLMAQMIQN